VILSQNYVIEHLSMYNRPVYLILADTGKEDKNLKLTFRKFFASGGRLPCFNFWFASRFPQLENYFRLMFFI
jgi:hypothetical protein